MILLLQSETQPDERVWKLTRKMCVHNEYFPTLQDLISTLNVNLFLGETQESTTICAII